MKGKIFQLGTEKEFFHVIIKVDKNIEDNLISFMESIGDMHIHCCLFEPHDEHFKGKNKVERLKYSDLVKEILPVYGTETKKFKVKLIFTPKLLHMIIRFNSKDKNELISELMKYFEFPKLKK